MTTQHFRATVIIRRTPEEVFRYTAAEYFQHRKEGSVQILQSEQTTPGPMRVGATGRELTLDRWGRHIETNYTVTEYEPNRRFAIEGIARFAVHQPEADAKADPAATPTRVWGTVTLEPVPQGTKATCENRYESQARGVNALLIAISSDRATEQYRKNIYDWKNRLEAQAGLAPEKPPFRPRLRRTWLAGALLALAFLLMFWLYVSREALQLAPPAVIAVQIGITALCALFVCGIYIYMTLKKSGY